MAQKIKPCKCGKQPELFDDRLGWFVRCKNHTPYIVAYGEYRREVDQCATDAEGTKLSESIDWDAVKQTAIDAWNAT